MVLNKLLQNGVGISIFTIKPICEIEKSPSKTAQTQVIDFDETKRKFVASHNQGDYGIKDPKSCDALKTLPVQRRVDFVEFKGFENFKRYQRIQNPDDPRIQGQVDQFHLDEKIADSLWIFHGLLYISQLGLSKAEIREINAAEKNYLVMVDLKIKEDPLLGLATTLDFLSHPSVDDSGKLTIDRAIWQVLQDKLDGFDENVQINKPILIGADKIDEYYQQLLV